MGNPNPNRKGLILYKKGQSGNPKGRPKVLPELKLLLAEVLGEEKDGVAAAKAILMALRAKATKGDVRAAEVLLDRAYGSAIIRQAQTNTAGEDAKTELSDTQLEKLLSAIQSNNPPG